MEGNHRLDCAGSSAGAAPGRGIGGEVCAGEGHYPTGLPIGAYLTSEGSNGAFLHTRATPAKRIQATALRLLLMRGAP